MYYQRDSVYIQLLCPVRSNLNWNDYLESDEEQI